MRYFPVFTIIGLLMSCQSQGTGTDTKSKTPQVEVQDYSKLDTATVAGGCFWCVEASFDQIKGVLSAVSGYAGGKKSNATYELVSSGKTKHAETVQVYYDPTVIDYGTILDIFFTAHDPTQVNRQGPDVGYQYRTAIFFHNEQQREIAQAKISELQKEYSQPIATELNAYTEFFIAEDYHQDYEKHHPYNPYIQNVSRPKIERVKKRFSDRLKETVD